MSDHLLVPIFPVLLIFSSKSWTRHVSTLPDSPDIQQLKPNRSLRPRTRLQNPTVSQVTLSSITILFCFFAILFCFLAILLFLFFLFTIFLSIPFSFFSLNPVFIPFLSPILFVFFSLSLFLLSNLRLSFFSRLFYHQEWNVFWHDETPLDWRGTLNTGKRVNTTSNDADEE